MLLKSYNPTLGTLQFFNKFHLTNRYQDLKKLVEGGGTA